MEAENQIVQSSLLALLDATKALASSRDPQEILQTIVETAARISGVPLVRLFLTEGADGRLEYRVGFGVPVGDPVNRPLQIGESLTGEVAATGRVLCVPDCRGDSRVRFPEILERLGLVSYLGLPVIFQGRLLGVLALSARDPRSYSAEEIRLMMAFADHAAIAIENARLLDADTRRTAELQGLLRTLRFVLAEEALQPILDEIVEEAARISGCAHVKLMLLDQEQESLTVGALRGTAMLGGDRLPVGTSLSGLVARTGEALYSGSVTDDARNVFAERDGQLGIVTYLGLPVRTRDELLGVLSFNTTSPRVYAEEEMNRLRSFADQAALAIEHVRLHEAVRRHVAELEARVRERTGKLEAALRVKAEFVAKMSHELRTPLNFILGYTQLLRGQIGGTLTSKQARFVERVYTAGRHLLGLVEELLDISLAEVGRERLRLERLPVAPVVREVLDLYAVQARQKRLHLDVRIEPALTLVADRGKLVQILSNLVGNAVKFTPAEGRIGVRARKAVWPAPFEGGAAGSPDETLPLYGQEEGVELVVEDSGIGIAGGDLERIFQGFAQVESSTAGRYDGAGIGLAVVRTLVNLHGGGVRAESEGLGRGARFVVCIPALPAGPQVRLLLLAVVRTLVNLHGGGVRAESEGLGRGARFVVSLPALPAGPQVRLLLLAADGAPAASLGGLLEEAGYLVERVATGDAALRAVAAAPPDLVLADLGGWPEGWAFLRRFQAMRDSGDSRRVRVLALTREDGSDTERALALGADEFVSEPVAPGMLGSAVRRVLAGRWRPVWAKGVGGTGGTAG